MLLSDIEVEFLNSSLFEELFDVYLWKVFIQKMRNENICSIW